MSKKETLSISSGLIDRWLNCSKLEQVVVAYLLEPAYKNANFKINIEELSLSLNKEENQIKEAVYNLTKEKILFKSENDETYSFDKEELYPSMTTPPKDTLFKI